MSASHDGALSARRKSFGFFTRPTMLPEIEPASTWSSRDHVIKQRPKSAFFSNGAGDYQEYTTVVSSNLGTHARPRVLTKSPAQRPKSMFGSLRSRDRDPGSPVIGMHFESSGSSSIDSSQSDNVPISPSNKFVVYSGEVISTGGLLRRKKEFMVLTNEELLRYKSEHKASEAFGIPTRSPTTGRAPSIGSVGELSNEHSLVTSAIQIVAVYRYGGDADLACTVQVDHLDDANGTPSSTVLQVSTPQEAQGWLEILRQVTHLARTAKTPPPFSNSTVEHIARRLEAEKDYSPSHFQIFRVVQRAGKMNGHKAGSSEDLQKMYSTICYLAIRQASEYLRPNYLITPFIGLPEYLNEAALPDIPCTPGDDFNGFDRTLSAYCTAYDLDASNIVYGVHMEVEDAPQFVLYPPAFSRRRQYTDLELLAVMRSLRWNESFCSISFRGINLETLHKVHDIYGSEYEPLTDRSNQPLNLKATGGKRSSLLIHELRALALYSGKLRLLDFYECMKRKPRVGEGAGGSTTQNGCGILEAIMPLCRRGLTNVDWFDLTGIELVESDLDWLVDAAASKLAHFRGFELARCGLTERFLTLFMNSLITHENTLESLDLSGNPGRIHAPSFNNIMSHFPFLRRLNLSRLLRTAGDDALLTAETLLRWRLEDLDLSETKLNNETIDAVSAYLASPQSDSLHHLTLTQCGLTSKDIAIFMHSMSRSPGKPRNLHLYIGQNQVAIQHDKLLECIRNGITPTHLTMRMVDYPKEDMFRELMDALRVNKTISFLDLSKVSLPYEAGQETCNAMGEMFAKNTSLKELALSGEQGVLESARLGAGLNKPLGRLAENKTLEILRIELQSLGTPGAMELASMLTKNTALRELYCEMNEIHLQGFSAIVNALEKNKTLLYFPRMERDRAEHVKCLKDKLFQPTDAEKSKKELKMKSSLGLRRMSKSEKKKVSFADDSSEVGAEQNLTLLEEKWESETQRMQFLLARNLELHHSKLVQKRLHAPLGSQL
ncbi:uncharacterized protein H6S33_012434 [Morchella sextelata]|uniref:uncharacterized protein n=1 Tax=Morchella sextelata TaxID=1174677 RepID=UPI001D051766|nr:uncharacterized protein H6S33_012434 [Morchella sextelata]KAH0609888.1 hypothetical protein H6S33_012434 [Morchella sextelata]